MMRTQGKTWLELFVDAMTEKDPYKRLALVHHLKNLPKHDVSGDALEKAAGNRRRKSKVTRHR